MKKTCNAVALSTGDQCKKRPLPGSRYCYFHVDKVPLLLTALLGAVLSLIVAEVYRSFVPSEESRRLASVEAKLEPFVEVAKSRFPQLETEAALQRLREELDEVRRLAEPPEMRLESHTVRSLEQGHFVLIKFSRSKDVPLGSLQFAVALPVDTAARILELKPAVQLSMNVRSRISEDGKAGRLEFALPGSEDPAIKLLLSGAAPVRVEGNHNLQPFVIDVK